MNTLILVALDFLSSSNQDFGKILVYLGTNFSDFVLARYQLREESSNLVLEQASSTTSSTEDTFNWIY